MRYDARYYREEIDPPFGWTRPWLKLNRHWAHRIDTEIGPETVFDAGCSFGILVWALRERGIKAWGGDISEYAIGQATMDVEPYLCVMDISESIPFGPYDLITCIEVMEHMTEADSIQAIANICAQTDDVIFSSNPNEAGVHSHINCHPIEYWVERFAEHGLELDEDYDATYISWRAFRVRR